MAQYNACAAFYRVESEADIADGPTRPDESGCANLQRLGATGLPASLPGWLVNLWMPYAIDVLAQDPVRLS